MDLDGRDLDRWTEALRYVEPASSSPGTPKELRQLLHRYGLHSRKGLGQTFLFDRDALTSIVSAAELDPSDVVVEVGPGLGALTRELAREAGRVLAVEVDPGLMRALADLLAGLDNVELVQADILKFDHVAHLGSSPYKVVANLPYYITSPILRRFLDATSKPSLMVVLVQREVAERIVSPPGDMSLLAVSVQFYGCPTIVGNVPASAFYPPPKVDSAILRIEVFDRPAEEVDVALFFKVVAAGFSQPRKQLHNAIQRGMWLPPGGAATALRRAGIDARRRAETLSVGEWAGLYRAMLELEFLKMPRA